MGIDEISKLVKSVAQFATALVNKSNVFSLISTLIGFSSVDWSKVLPEGKDLSDAEIAVLEGVFNDNFQPNSAAVKVKITDILDLAQRTEVEIKKDVVEGMDVYAALSTLISDWKSVLGV